MRTVTTREMYAAVKRTKVRQMLDQVRQHCNYNSESHFVGAMIAFEHRLDDDGLLDTRHRHGENGELPPSMTLARHEFIDALTTPVSEANRVTRWRQRETARFFTFCYLVDHFHKIREKLYVSNTTNSRHAVLLYVDNAFSGFYHHYRLLPPPPPPPDITTMGPCRQLPGVGERGSNVATCSSQRLHASTSFWHFSNQPLANKFRHPHRQDAADADTGRAHVLPVTKGGRLLAADNSDEWESIAALRIGSIICTMCLFPQDLHDRLASMSRVRNGRPQSGVMPLSVRLRQLANAEVQFAASSERWQFDVLDRRCEELLSCIDDCIRVYGRSNVLYADDAGQGAEELFGRQQ